MVIRLPRWPRSRCALILATALATALALLAPPPVYLSPAPYANA